MLEPADARGLNIRYSAIILLISLLSGFAAFSGGTGYFRDTQAFLIVGVLALMVLAVSVGATVRIAKAHVAFAVLVLIYLISSTSSAWWAESLLETGLFLGYLAVFFLGANLVGGERRRLAMHALTIIGVAVAVFALYQFLIGHTAQVKMLRELGYKEEARQLAVMSSQAFGNFPSANSLAGWLILVIPVALGLMVSEIDFRVKLWSAFAGMTMVVALYFTFSRAALIALLFSLLAGFVLWAIRSDYGRRALLPAFLGSLTVGIGFIWFFFRFSADAFMNTFAGRAELWRAAAAMATDHPWFGVGPFGFGTALMKYQVGAAYSRYAHNSFLQAAAEIGWPGLLALLMVFGLVLARAWRLYKEADSATAWQRLGLIAGLMALMIHNIFDYSWYLPAVGLVFWWIAGLAVGDDRDAPSAGATPGTGRSLVALGIILAIIPFVVLIFSQSAATSVQSGYDHYFFSHVSRPGSARVEEGGRDLADDGSGHDVSDEMEAVHASFQSARRYFPYDSNIYDTYAGIIYKETTGGRGGSLSEAATLQRKAISLRPSWPFYHLRLAQIYKVSGKLKASRREYERAAALGAMDPRFSMEFGYFLFGLGDPKKALVEFEKAIALGRTYDRDYTSLDIASARGDQSEPLTNIGRAYIGAAYARVQLKEYAEATKALIEGKRLLGKTTDVLTAEGQVWERQGGFERAAVAYRAAYRKSARDNEVAPGVKAKPDADIIVRLAAVLEKAGREREALRRAREALSIDSKQAEARAVVGRLKAK